MAANAVKAVSDATVLAVVASAACWPLRLAATAALAFAAGHLLESVDHEYGDNYSILLRTDRMGFVFGVPMLWTNL